MWAASVAPPASLLTMLARCSNPGSMTLLAVPLSSLSTVLSVRAQKNKKNNASGMLMCFCFAPRRLPSSVNRNLHVVTFVFTCLVFPTVSRGYDHSSAGTNLHQLSDVINSVLYKGFLIPIPIYNIVTFSTFHFFNYCILDFRVCKSSSFKYHWL